MVNSLKRKCLTLLILLNIVTISRIVNDLCNDKDSVSVLKNYRCDLEDYTQYLTSTENKLKAATQNIRSAAKKSRLIYSLTTLKQDLS